MGNKLTNKDKREVVRRNAIKFLMAGDTPALAYDLYWNERDITWVTDQYQFPVWMTCRTEIGQLFDYSDLNMVRREVASLANTLDIPKVDKRERLTEDSAIPLVGKYAPRISRRADLTPAQITVDALQAQSNFPFVLDHRCTEIFSAYRESLPYEEREGFLPERTLREWGLITGEFYCPVRLMDEQGRMYADTRGTVSPMYDKVSRAVTRCAYSTPLTKDDMKVFEAWLNTEFDIEGSVESWVDGILQDPQRFLRDGGKAMAIGAAFGWYDAVKNGESNYIMYIDAPASGLGHIYARAGHSALERMVNMNHRDYVHPYVQLAAVLRNVDVHNLRGASLTEIASQIAKPTANPGQYGGTHMAIASKILDLDHDGDAWLLGQDSQRVPCVPPLLADAFEGITDPVEICNRMVEMCKPYGRAFRRLFTPITAINKQAQEVWKAGMLTDGIPTAMVDRFGYVNQPTPFSRQRLVRPLDIVRAKWVEDGKRIGNNYPAFRCDIADAGTQALAKRIHTDDAKTASFASVDLALQNVHSVWIHDCCGILISNVSKALDSYRRGFETVHEVNLPADAVMLR